MPIAVDLGDGGAGGAGGGGGAGGALSEASLTWSGSLHPSGGGGGGGVRVLPLPLGCGAPATGGSSSLGLDIRVLGDDPSDTAASSDATEGQGAATQWAWYSPDDHKDGANAGAAARAAGVRTGVNVWPIPVGQLGVRNRRDGGVNSQGPWLAACSDGDDTRFIVVTAEADGEVSSAAGGDALGGGAAWRLVGTCKHCPPRHHPHGSEQPSSLG